MMRHTLASVLCNIWVQNGRELQILAYDQSSWDQSWNSSETFVNFNTEQKARM
jgi:hypothetical protein